MPARRKSALTAAQDARAGRTGAIARNSELKQRGQSSPPSAGAKSDSAKPSAKSASAKSAGAKASSAKPSTKSASAKPDSAKPSATSASAKPDGAKPSAKRGSAKPDGAKPSAKRGSARSSAKPDSAKPSAEPVDSKPGARFTGFPEAGQRFLEELSRRQDRDWFKEHKADYEAHCEAPLLALLEATRSRLSRAYPDCELLPPKVFRPQRDVRFSQDKAPYKTHVAGWIPLRRLDQPTRTPVALYLQLGADEDIAGAGVYELDKTGLEQFRERILDEQTGDELAKLVKKLVRGGFTITAREQLKKAPRGLDPEHPRAELLKLKGLIATFPHLPAELRHERRLLDWVVAHGKKAAPLVRWLAYNTVG